MSPFSSITKTQWVIIVDLFLAVVLVYCIASALIVSSMNAPAAPVVELPGEFTIEIAQVETPTFTPTFTRMPTRITPTPTLAPSTETPAPMAVLSPTLRPVPAKMSPNTFADWYANPRAMLATKTNIFTSACFGLGANPLQDRDFMTPADWSSEPDRKCIFGFNVNPIDRMPTARYSVFGGPDGQPRFYIIPPEAFAKDTQSIKILSQMHLIVDPEQGCDSLGFIGVTADGYNYQTPACSFLKPGGASTTLNGSHTLVLPNNQNNVLDVGATGGAYGFLNYPLVTFRKDFSLYFTGRAGYAPARLWFENTVDTLASNVNVKTSAEMTLQESRALAAQFDRLFSNGDPKSQVMSLEREVPASSANPVTIPSRQEATINFKTTPGVALSSVSWRVTPFNDGKRKTLESNICLVMNGEETCFTGVEDFAHCAFFTPCVTGFSNLQPIEREGYIATRYFPAGAAPIIRDGNIAARFLAPDIGSVMEIDVKIRVRTVDATLSNQ